MQCRTFANITAPMLGICVPTLVMALIIALGEIGWVMQLGVPIEKHTKISQNEVT